MATFAIGDVHGCYRELRRLLDQMPIDPASDRLWMVGDLVNRGPQSLKVLRWARKRARKMGPRFQVVLGNHEIYLLALGEGLARPRAADTAKEILAAEDREELLAWIREWPLVHRDDGYLLVHGGLWPEWTADAAEEWARRVEAALRKGKGKARKLLDRRISRAAMDDTTAELDRALQAFVRLRTCTRKGKACAYAGPPRTAPKGCLPWFEVPERRSTDVTVVCGHWAALGLRIQPGLFALDTGCVWGGALTGVRLDDGTVYTQKKL